MRDKLDVITLRGIRARGNHGVYAFERENSQPFGVDLSLYVDTRAAARSDDIGQTVDYARIAKQVVDVLTGPPVYLVETLASRVAEAVLANPRVRAVDVTIHKPEAPLQEQFGDVSVTIRRSREDAEQAPAPLVAPAPAAAHSHSHRRTPEPEPAERPQRPQPARRTRVEQRERAVVLAIGGNLGDVPASLRQVVDALTHADGLEVEQVSPLVRTAPVLASEQAAQPDYWDAVVLGHTTLDPWELLDLAHAVEDELGRERRERWGARTVDVDIVQVEGVRMDDPSLTLPHPRAHERAFVLVPWSLADRDAVLDGFGPVGDLAVLAPDRRGVKDIKRDWLTPSAAAPEPAPGAVTRPEPPQLPSRRSAPPPARTIAPRTPTKLDRMPRASQEKLAPSGGGGDYLWQHLWEQWQRPDGSGQRPRQVGPSHAGAPDAPPPQRRSRRADPGGGAAQQGPDPSDHSLPTWGFRDEAAPRIVDDPHEIAPLPERRASRPRMILDPGLSPDTPTGPRDDAVSSTSVLRRITVRPTVSGQQTIQRRQGGGGRQLQ